MTDVDREQLHASSDAHGTQTKDNMNWKLGRNQKGA